MISKKINAKGVYYTNTTHRDVDATQLRVIDFDVNFPEFIPNT